MAKCRLDDDSGEVVRCLHEEKLCRARSLAKSRGAVVHVENEITKLIQHYYSCATIRSRINEFMGGSTEGNATAIYVVGNDGVSGFSQPAAPAELGDFLLAGDDVERSYGIVCGSWRI